MKRRFFLVCLFYCSLLPIYESIAAIFWQSASYVFSSRSLYNVRYRDCCNEAWNYAIQLVVRFCNEFFKLKLLFLLSLHLVDN